MEHLRPVPISQDDGMKHQLRASGVMSRDVLGGRRPREGLPEEKPWGHTHWLQEETDQLKKENHLLSISKFSFLNRGLYVKVHLFSVTKLTLARSSITSCWALNISVLFGLLTNCIAPL